MILLESLLDQDAFPWQADWYRSRVKAALGDRLDSNFRLWFTDHAVHSDSEQESWSAQTVSYLGVLHQALRDLSAWVERGIAPPPSTSYKVVDGQIHVPDTAVERKGIQPVVMLTANGISRAEVSTNSPVSFAARIELPPGTGRIVAAEWDFLGTGSFQPVDRLDEFNSSDERLTLAGKYQFLQPGTYFPVLRATSQRQGDAATSYARIQNLGRVRVVVR